MTPVAGGITDGEKNGFIFLVCFFEGFVTPGIPVDGIIGVLEKVRAFFVNETVLIQVILINPF